MDNPVRINSNPDDPAFPDALRNRHAFWHRSQRNLQPQRHRTGRGPVQRMTIQ